MLNVWILQTGEPLQIDSGNPRPMRAMNLSNAMIDAGHRVTLWSSRFNHQERCHRPQQDDCIILSNKFEIRLIPSPGYRQNIGFGRLWDHAVLAFNLKKMLKFEHSQPDIAFIGYPPIETSVVMAKWMNEKKVPFLLDLKDQWPSIFLDKFPKVLKPLGRLILKPYAYLAWKSMKYATGMSAMAESFLEWGLDYAGRDQNLYDKVFPLTSPQNKCSKDALIKASEWWDELGIKHNHDIVRIIFIGSHMAVFDFEPIRSAAATCARGHLPVEFVICGDGGSSQEFKNMMKNLPNVHFPGWIDRPKIEVLAERSQATLIPYQNIDCYIRSIPNKVIDSLSLGLPILSPLQGEVAQLINKYKVGISYNANNGRSLIECIKIITNNFDLQKQLSRNARNLYEREFTYKKVYGGLVNHLDYLAKINRL